MSQRGLCLVCALCCVTMQFVCADASKFTSVPTTVKCFENDTVLLPCYIEHIESDTRVRWWKGEELLGDSHDPHHLLPERVRMWTNRSLEISSLRAADTAAYTCEVVRHEPWSSIKQVHAIDVQYAPVVRPLPADGFAEVQKGEYVDIGCEVAGNPQPTVSWSKNGEPLALLEPRTRIRFKAESRALAGVYECSATNGVGEPVKATIQLLIMDAPVVTARRSWVHTTPGLRAELEAELEFATPPATTRWFKDGVQIHSDDRVVMVVRDHVHQLIVRNVRVSDLGNYTFRAENRLGMADVSFRLSGVPNAAVFKVDPSRNKATATSFTLLWEVDSDSVIIEHNLWLRPYAAHNDGADVVTEDTRHNRWRKIVIPAGVAISGPIHTTSYVVTGLSPGKVYQAFVTSRNRFGWSKPSSTLNFVTDPGNYARPSTPDYELETPVVIEEIIEETRNESALLFEKQENRTNSATNIDSSVISFTVVWIIYFLK